MSVTVLHIASPFAVTRTAPVGETHGSGLGSAPETHQAEDRQPGDRPDADKLNLSTEPASFDVAAQVSQLGGTDDEKRSDDKPATPLPTMRSVQAAYATMMDVDIEAVGIISPSTGDGRTDVHVTVR